MILLAPKAQGPLLDLPAPTQAPFSFVGGNFDWLWLLLLRLTRLCTFGRTSPSA